MMEEVLELGRIGYGKARAFQVKEPSSENVRK